MKQTKSTTLSPWELRVHEINRESLEIIFTVSNSKTNKRFIRYSALKSFYMTCMLMYALEALDSNYGLLALTPNPQATPHAISDCHARMAQGSFQLMLLLPQRQVHKGHFGVGWQRKSFSKLYLSAPSAFLFI